LPLLVVKSKHSFIHNQGIEKIPRITVGSTLIAQEDDNEDNLDLYKLQNFKIGNQVRACVLERTKFGIHDWSVTFKKDDILEEKTVIGTAFCTSCTFEYATALDEGFDLLYWGWGYGGIY
jgi:hypothetical protein